MKAFKIKFVFDRRKKVTSPNMLGDIEIYVYDPNRRKKNYIQTGVSVTANQFHQPKGEIGEVIKNPNSVSLNGQLRKVYRGVQDFILSDRCKGVQDISNWDKKIELEGDYSDNLIEFMDKELARRNPSMNVIKRYNTLITRLMQFQKIVTFDDLTYENISDFDVFLKTESKDREAISDATAQKRHSMLKSYIIEAVNRGLCKYNPYLTFKPKKGKSKDPIYLTEWELESMATYDLDKKDPTKRMIRVRDLFVFQCYTGLAYTDLRSFSKEDIIEIEGYKAITNSRHKTDVNYITVLLPEAIEILEKYNYELPKLSNQKYNDYLKALTAYIVDKKGKPIINKSLTSHVARHTCGTYLLNKGVPMETVSRTLGHTNTNMTRHYARLLGKTVVSDIAKYVINAKK